MDMVEDFLVVFLVASNMLFICFSPFGNSKHLQFTPGNLIVRREKVQDKLNPFGGKMLGSFGGTLKRRNPLSPLSVR
ncbi:MAG: hypothetical protein D3916_03300 [Candidatus Electrothrix sp. MAN1_4]|nr:hypothetical protein [Candidatus Electrothrix sp. MAN1_4]